MRPRWEEVARAVCASPHVFTRLLTAISTSPPWGGRCRHTLLSPIAEVEYAPQGFKILPVEQAASRRGARVLPVAGLYVYSGFPRRTRASIDPSSRSASAISFQDGLPCASLRRHSRIHGLSDNAVSLALACRTGSLRR